MKRLILIILYTFLTNCMEGDLNRSPSFNKLVQEFNELVQKNNIYYSISENLEDIENMIENFQPKDYYNPIVETSKAALIFKKLIQDEITASTTDDFCLYYTMCTRNILLFLAATYLVKTKRRYYPSSWEEWKFYVTDAEKKFLSDNNAIIIKDRTNEHYTVEDLSPYFISLKGDNPFLRILRMFEKIEIQEIEMQEHEKTCISNIINIIMGFFNIAKQDQENVKNDIWELCKDHGQNTCELVRLKTDIYNQSLYDVTQQESYEGIFTEINGEKRFYHDLFVNGQRTTKESMDIKNILAANNNIKINLFMNKNNNYTNQYINVIDIHNTVTETFPKFYDQLKVLLKPYQYEKN